MLIGRRIIGTIGVMGGVPWQFTEFCKCYGDLLAFNATNLTRPDEEIKRVWATVSTHAVARNGLVDEREGDWLLFLDCDMHFDPDLLGRMLRTAEQYSCPVLTGVYHYGVPPHLPVLYQWDGKGFSQIAKFDNTEPFLVGGGGGGCLLVQNWVFDRIEEAFPDRGPFTIEPPYGTDDLPFYAKCHQLGIPVGCDPRVQCGHLRVTAIGQEQHAQSLEGLELTPMEVPAWQRQS